MQETHNKERIDAVKVYDNMKGGTTRNNTQKVGIAELGTQIRK